MGITPSTATPRLTDTDRAILQLKLQRDSLSRQIAAARLKSPTSSTRTLITQAESHQRLILNLLSSLDQAQSNAALVAALKQGSVILGKMQDRSTLADVHAMVDQAHAQAQLQDELDQALGQTDPGQIESSQREEELEAALDDLLPSSKPTVVLPDAPQTILKPPTSIPTLPSTPQAIPHPPTKKQTNHPLPA